MSDGPILVTGANGQVGFELAHWLRPHGRVVAIDSDTLDVDRARLGASIGFPNAPGVSGVLLVDAFESRRTELVGPE